MVHLHSNMVRLKVKRVGGIQLPVKYLHSNMVRLKDLQCAGDEYIYYSFTFQYGKIKRLRKPDNPL